MSRTSFMSVIEIEQENVLKVNTLCMYLVKYNLGVLFNNTISLFFLYLSFSETRRKNTPIFTSTHLIYTFMS